MKQLAGSSAIGRNLKTGNTRQCLEISNNTCKCLLSASFAGHSLPLLFNPPSMKPEKTFMQEAIKLSIEKMEAGFGGPFGCVIVKDGKIIARGFNNVLVSNDPTAHAEVDAIRKACQELGTHQLKGCELYTSCEPCPMCLGAIYWARPDVVYYANTKEDAAAIGFDDHFIYAEIDKPITERYIPMIPFMREDALEGFKKWETKPDKGKY